MSINITLAFNVNKAAKMLGIHSPVVHVSESFCRRGRKAYTLVNLTGQQVKMLVALNDSTPTTVARYLQPEFVEAFDKSGGDISAFFNNLNCDANPLNSALAMLKGGGL